MADDKRLYKGICKLAYQGDYGVSEDRDMVDVRDGDGNEIGEELADLVAYLPHSCDEWVIGDKDELLAFIADCQRAADSWPDDGILKPGTNPSE